MNINLLNIANFNHRLPPHVVQLVAPNEDARLLQVWINKRKWFWALWTTVATFNLLFCLVFNKKRKIALYVTFNQEID